MSLTYAVIYLASSISIMLLLLPIILWAFLEDLLASLMPMVLWLMPRRNVHEPANLLPTHIAQRRYVIYRTCDNL